MGAERNPWGSGQYPRGNPTEGSGKRSKFEEQIEAQGKAAGLTMSFESSKLPYVSLYVPDFVVTRADGRLTYIETKGWFTPEDRAKTLKVIKANAGIDLRLIFMSDNKLNSKSKTRYSDWCNKHGIPFAFRQIPQEWIAEFNHR